MIHLEILDTIKDIHRAGRNFVEPLGDGFQWPDVLTFISGLKDDDPDNKTGTVVDGFVKDLPVLISEFRGIQPSDARQTVAAAVSAIRAEFSQPHPFTETFCSVVTQAVETYAYLAEGPKIVQGWGKIFLQPGK